MGAEGCISRCRGCRAGSGGPARKEGGTFCARQVCLLAGEEVHATQRANKELARKQHDSAGPVRRSKCESARPWMETFRADRTGNPPCWSYRPRQRHALGRNRAARRRAPVAEVEAQAALGKRVQRASANSCGAASHEEGEDSEPEPASQRQRASASQRPPAPASQQTTRDRHASPHWRRTGQRTGSAALSLLAKPVHSSGSKRAQRVGKPLASRSGHSSPSSLSSPPLTPLWPVVVPVHK